MLGIAALAIGIRGVRIDDHPLCRKCGFDLTGKPSEVDRCGECGAFVNNPKSIRIGHRRRRGRFVGGGLIVLLPTILIAAVIGWGTAHGVNWLKLMPVGWLTTRAGSADPLRRTPALAELASRYKNGLLPASQWNTVIDAGLAYQGDLAKPWDTAWGDLLESFQRNQKLSAGSFTRPNHTIAQGSS